MFVRFVLGISQSYNLTNMVFARFYPRNLTIEQTRSYGTMEGGATIVTYIDMCVYIYIYVHALVAKGQVRNGTVICWT